MKRLSYDLIALSIVLFLAARLARSLARGCSTLLILTFCGLAGRYVRVGTSLTIGTFIVLGACFGVLLKWLAIRKAPHIPGRPVLWLFTYAAAFGVSLLAASSSGGMIGLDRIYTLAIDFLVAALVLAEYRSSSISVFNRLYAFGATLVMASIFVESLLSGLGTDATLLYAHRDGIERFGGIFGDSNFAALLIASAIPLLFSFTGQEQKYRGLKLAATAMVMFRCVYLTGSLAGLVLLVLAIIVSLMTLNTSRPKPLELTFGVLATTAVLLALFVAVRDPRFGFSTSLGLFAERRGVAWSSAASAFGSSVIVGIGPGNIVTIAGMRAHNMVLETLAEVGIAGMVPFSVLIYLALSGLMRSVKDSRLYPRETSSRLASVISILVWLAGGVALSINYEEFFWGLLSIGWLFGDRRRTPGFSDDMCVQSTR